MKKMKWLSLIALVLAVTVAFSGCFLTDAAEYLFNALSGGENVKFSEMTYTRPDMEEFQEILDHSCQLAETSEDIEEVLAGVWEYYDAYDEFSTMTSLADIHCCMDLTDAYWQEEYGFCADHIAQADAGLDRLFRQLAKSPILEELESELYFGAGYFDDYQGESLWDETFLELNNREQALIGEFYEISGKAVELTAYSEEYYQQISMPLAELYVELIGVRQEIAAYAGYDSFVQYCYDMGTARDYTPSQIEAYSGEIREKLVPLYRKINEDMWAWECKTYSQSQIYDYTRSVAREIGGEIQECFQVMERREMYDISYSGKKINASFEVYLPMYGVPYVFVSPQGSIYDPMAFTHEFGHFCNDYLCGGSYLSEDVAEIFSQGLEYLALFYGPEDPELKRAKLIQCLNIYVEQAAYNDFEQQAYGLRGEALTTENLLALAEQIGRDYGFEDWGFEPLDMMGVTHFFTSPMYVISYVLSNDAAFGYYQMEQAQAGKGLSMYLDHLVTEQPYFLEFLEEAQLESPFEPGRIDSVAEILKTELNLS